MAEIFQAVRPPCARINGVVWDREGERWLSFCKSLGVSHPPHPKSMTQRPTMTSQCCCSRFRWPETPNHKSPQNPNLHPDPDPRFHTRPRVQGAPFWIWGRWSHSPPYVVRMLSGPLLSQGWGRSVHRVLFLSVQREQLSAACPSQCLSYPCMFICAGTVDCCICRPPPMASHTVDPFHLKSLSPPSVNQVGSRTAVFEPPALSESQCDFSGSPRTRSACIPKDDWTPQPWILHDFSRAFNMIHIVQYLG